MEKDRDGRQTVPCYLDLPQSCPIAQCVNKNLKKGASASRTNQHQQCNIRRKLKDVHNQRKRMKISLISWKQLKRDVLHRTAGVPIFLLKELKASAEMMAPTFPEAADVP